MCTGKAVPKPVVVDGEIVIRTIMNCIYTCDHRFGDAAIVVRFVRIIKDFIEDPENFKAEKYADSIIPGEPIKGKQN